MVLSDTDECAKCIFDDSAVPTEIWNMSVRTFYYAAESHPGLVIIPAQDGSKTAVCKSSWNVEEAFLPCFISF